eukprot:3832311-Pleurochrysis_carterae.AAC.1
MKKGARSGLLAAGARASTGTKIARSAKPAATDRRPRTTYAKPTRVLLSPRPNRTMNRRALTSHSVLYSLRAVPT